MDHGPAASFILTAFYGADVAFREGLDELGLIYSVGVKANTSVWAPGVEPLPPKAWSGKGRRPKNMVIAPGHEPVSVETITPPPQAPRAARSRPRAARSTAPPPTASGSCGTAARS